VTVGDRRIAYWIWTPVIRNGIQDTIEYWNTHKIRKQRDKALGSGQSPLEMLRTCEERGEMNCILPIRVEVIQEWKDRIMERIREDGEENDLEFWTPNQHKLLSKVWTQLGAPDVALNNAWNIFMLMRDAVSEIDGLDADFWEDGVNTEIKIMSDSSEGSASSDSDNDFLKLQ